MNLNLTEQQLNFLLAVLDNLEIRKNEMYFDFIYDKELIKSIIQDVEYWQNKNA